MPKLSQPSLVAIKLTIFISLIAFFHYSPSPAFANHGTIMSGKTLADYKAPYPEPTADQKRFAIFLEPKENEDDFKVELLIGRVEKVDSFNFQALGGKVEEKTIEGWGYTYYVATLNEHGISTMRGYLGEVVKVDRFIQMYSEKLYRYNSKLPIVVYVPKNAEVRYKIWTAPKDATHAQEV